MLAGEECEPLLAKSEENACLVDQDLHASLLAGRRVLLLASIIRRND